MTCSSWTLKAVLRPASATRERLYAQEPGRLSMAEREEITAGIVAGDTYAAIAVRLGRSVSMISREVARNGGRPRYRAYRAHRNAGRCARRPKTAELVQSPQLRTTVEGWLGELWSPERIAQRLRLEHPDDPMMRVSHETIYQSLFGQGRGALKRELVKCLCTGRVERLLRGRSRSQRRG